MIKIRNFEGLRKALWHFRHGGLRQLKEHRKRAIAETGNQSSLVKNSLNGKLDLQPWKFPDELNRRTDLNVAVILDEFSTQAWSYEWNQIPVTPERWRKVFDDNDIDFLFVESAWNGNSGAWQYHLTGENAPRREFIELLAYCNAKNIPTVFWNKEDPTHFSDFLPAARLFKFVYTTDVDRLEDYVRELGHERVGVLPFAAQQAIHHPIRPATGHHSRDIAFGGMYFSHRHESRRKQMDLLLGAAHDVSDRMAHGLEIYSRFYGGDEKYQFPEPLSDHVVGSLTYQQMLSAYRLHKVFLNVNTVNRSPSMCARRIFEIIASGTPVVSTPSRAISEFFPDEMVYQAKDRQEAAFMLRSLVNNEELRARAVHRGQRQVWSAHTYRHRVERILNDLNIGKHTEPELSASMLVSTNRPHQLRHIMEMVSQQRDVKAETLVLTHGFEVARSEIQSLLAEFEARDVHFLHGSSDLTLGECLNRLIEASSGDVVAKIDDDDFYSPFYLRDQMNALIYSNAAVVGKNARYIFSEANKILMLQNANKEHRFSSFVAGPTIVTSREVASEIKFEPLSVGEDTNFLDRVISTGGSIYAADRFNFIQYRRAQNADSLKQHTWKISDWELLANSQVVSYSWDPSFVTV